MCAGKLASQDVLLFCTGYQYKFPFIDDAVVAVRDNAVTPLCVPRAGSLLLLQTYACAPLRGHRYHQLFHAAMPTLALVSIPLRVDPWPCADIQAQALHAVWSGAAALPDTETRLQQQPALLADVAKRGEPPHHVHLMGQKQCVHATSPVSMAKRYHRSLLTWCVLLPCCTDGLLLLQVGVPRPAAPVVSRASVAHGDAPPGPALGLFGGTCRHTP